MIQREEIEALIPHSGRMCLIDKVLDWDEASINCSTQSHTRADNPLRKDAKLGAVHLLEYGAQAMAIHGALLAKSEGKVLATALLAGAKNVQFYVQRLDDVAAELCAFSTAAGSPGWIDDVPIQRARR